MAGDGVGVVEFGELDLIGECLELFAVVADGGDGSEIVVRISLCEPVGSVAGEESHASAGHDVGGLEWGAVVFAVGVVDEAVDEDGAVVEGGADGSPTAFPVGNGVGDFVAVEVEEHGALEVEPDVVWKWDDGSGGVAEGAVGGGGDEFGVAERRMLPLGS